MKVYKFPVAWYHDMTAHIGDAEDLCYRRLLDLYLLNEQPLTLDVGSLCYETNMDDDVVKFVLDEFFIKTSDGYRHTRADEIVARHQRRVALNKKISVLPRKKRLQPSNG